MHRELAIFFYPAVIGFHGQFSDHFTLAGKRGTTFKYAKTVLLNYQ